MAEHEERPQGYYDDPEGFDAGRYDEDSITHAAYDEYSEMEVRALREALELEALIAAWDEFHATLHPLEPYQEHQATVEFWLELAIERELCRYLGGESAAFERELALVRAGVVTR